MPSPIIHLHHLFMHEQNPTPERVLGTIAPDAIHMRAGAGWGDKAQTHFYDSGLVAATAMLSGQTPQLRLGYLNHLKLDYRWRDTIYAPFFHAHKNQMERPDLYALYYQEMAQLDRAILKEAHWLETATQLLNQAKVLGLPLLSASEINGWRQKVLTDLGQPPSPEYPQLFSQPLIDAFLKGAT